MCAPNPVQIQFSKLRPVCESVVTTYQPESLSDNQIVHVGSHRAMYSSSAYSDPLPANVMNEY